MSLRINRRRVTLLLGRLGWSFQLRVLGTLSVMWSRRESPPRV